MTFRDDHPVVRPVPPSMRFYSLPLALMLFVGCSGKDPAADDTGDTGTDDSGETGDSDTEPPPVVYTSLAGSLTYYLEIGGQIVCDTDVALTSREYTGTCDGCDFAFYIDAEITREGGDDSCQLFPPLSWVPGTYNGIEYKDLSLIHIPKLGSSGYNFYNVVYTGYSAVYRGYDYPGPYYYMVGYGGGYFGRTTFRDLELNLDWYLNQPAAYYYNYAYLDACGAEEIPTSTAISQADGVTRTSRLGCDRVSGDLWTFEVADQAELAVSLDTLADDTTFDSLLVINGPDGCTEVLAQDNFLCSYPPPTYLCPAWAEPRAEGGTWQVAVLNMGSCAGDVAEYALTVEGVEDITLTSDNFDAFTVVGDSFFLTVLMNAQLTVEQ